MVNMRYFALLMLTPFESNFYFSQKNFQSCPDINNLGITTVVLFFVQVDQPIGGPPSSTKDASAHGPGGDACATCHLTPAGEHCTQQCHPTLEEWEAGLTAAAIDRQRLDEDNEEDLCSASASANAEADWQEDQFEEEVKCGGGDPIGPPPAEEDQEDRVDLGHQKPIGTLALTRTRPLAGVVALKKLWK